jgi:DNA-binding CsgD family transcriptional regulator
MMEVPNQEISNRIEEAIAGIASIAEMLPGVVIIHDMRDWSVVWMSQLGLRKLGITAEEVKAMSAEEYYSRFFNPEDTRDYVPKVFGLIERNNDEETVTYFQQVKFSGNADWHWHMSSTRIFMRDTYGQPLLIITMSFPVDPKHHLSTKAGRLLEENNFLRKNFYLYTKLSQREREVLRLLALGKSATDTAAELFISLNTVETHRKNIKQKLNTNLYYELCEYARAFDLI